MSECAFEQNAPAAYWAGIDVAKAAFDAAVLPCGLLGGPADLRRIPTERFERSPEGAQAFLAWLAQRVPEAGAAVRACMEATGSYSAELAGWLGPLRPAIVNPRQTAAFMKSLGLRNKTDRLEARALALYGAERNQKWTREFGQCVKWMS